MIVQIDGIFQLNAKIEIDVLFFVFVGIQKRLCQDIPDQNQEVFVKDFMSTAQCFIVAKKNCDAGVNSKNAGDFYSQGDGEFLSRFRFLTKDKKLYT